MIESEIVNRSEKTILNIEDEMIAMILNELDLPTLIKCRSLCKRIKFLIDNYQFYNIKINQLTIIRPWDFFVNFGYQHENRFSKASQINLKRLINSIHLEHYFNSSNFFDYFFQNVKELYFNTELWEEQFYIINKFPNLETLFIIEIKYVNEHVINLPYLKNLALASGSKQYGLIKKYKSQLIIESKIENFRFKSFCSSLKFVFKYPENIEYFDFSDTAYNAGGIKRFFCLSDFENVRILYVSKGIDENELMKLNKLEEIHILYWQYKWEMIDYVSRLFELKKKEKLKIKKLYFCDIELIEPTRDYLGYNREFYNTVLENQLLNYKLLNNKLINLRFFDYNILMNNLSKNKDLFHNLDRHKLIPELPSNFFLKFTDIKYLKVKNMKIDNKFIMFLDECRYLKRLDMISCSIEQYQLDQLSISNKTLMNLILENLELDSKELNLNFICKLKLICQLKISLKSIKNLNLDFLNDLKSNIINELKLNVELDIKLALKLIKNNENLCLLEFWYLGNLLTLRRISLFNENRFLCFHKSELSKKILKLNRNWILKSETATSFIHRPVFAITYFNQNISAHGFRYEQLIDYCEKIPELVQNELKNGNELVYEKNFDMKAYEFAYYNGLT